MVYNAARMKDAGVNFVKEAAMAKLFASAGGRARDLARHRDLWRLRIYKGLSGREVLARCQDRQDLRRHVEHAAGYNRKACARGVGDC